MKQISLTQGKITTVDDGDYDYLMQWKWYAFKHHRTFYAARYDQENGKQIRVRMHNVLLGEKVDHKDRNGLNNQRSNLRNYTGNQNCYNRSAKINGTSKYLGVFRRERKSKNGNITVYYEASIRKNGKLMWLGQSKDEEVAAKMYDEKANKLWGEFANLNFKKEISEDLLLECAT